jgi:hypothetical protein
VEEIFDFITHLTGVSISFFLLFLVVIDTMSAFSARIKLKIGLLSKRMGQGTVIKCGLAMIPAFVFFTAHSLDAVDMASREDQLLMHFLILIIGFFLTVSEAISILAYQKISNPEATNILVKITDKYLGAEVNSKLEKLGLTNDELLRLHREKKAKHSGEGADSRENQ